MKLYYKPGACSLSPHIVLREAGLDFSIEKVDLVSKKTEHDADFLAINPKGQVPVLQLDDGSFLTENAVIVQYLADQKPDRQLLPEAGTPARYHALEWLNYVATELHKGFSPLFNPRFPDEAKTVARELLEKKFIFLNDQLAEKEYLLGSRFSVADAYLFTVLNWANALKFDFSALPHLSAFVERMKARPAVDAALTAEGLK
ncbi:glutathione transferase GstA [Chimaeribacter arupi]|uniref:Glutathione transferase GstA n=2 Tax=Yersiniaceae TaxID=1903411 RepID=A0A2N5ESW0_9GAMM|nr:MULTISPECIES: glutathione transferase GstA [Yersiniaceae]MBS0970085.1 glutathione transferase GstA [Nissabacter archeti]MDV5140119.1 glutathione transferase GstA [Chimaeribacter arupi]PLR40114.1 glutathione transferase GstA [Chimaeribacter arupi]PLR46850.1 glutathione transferase GstA [Chimaeribacter arupi]PLR49477.1 glutathione transferase GstA [Chimaeribacter arupi]